MKNSTRIILWISSAIVFSACFLFFYTFLPSGSAIYFPAFASVVFIMAVVSCVILVMCTWIYMIKLRNWVIKRKPRN